MEEKVLVLDFGGQYNQLIARRVRECNVYCEIKPYTTSMDEIRKFHPIGIIFTGGPNSVYLDSAPHVDPAIFEMGVPVLGICYGCPLMAHRAAGSPRPRTIPPGSTARPRHTMIPPVSFSRVCRSRAFPG